MTSSYADVCEALGVCLVANVPVLLWGPPGAGKTTVIEGLGSSLGMHVETVIASIYSPSEFAGLPFVNDVEKTVTLYPPQWAKRVKEQADQTDSPGAIVFYDEISTAPESVQAALLRPILSGWVGELQLPKRVRSVAAANPPDQAAGGWPLSPPMANRFVHLDWQVPADVIRDGFNGMWPEIPVPRPDPTQTRAAFADIMQTLGVFIGSRPELASAVPSDADAAGLAFPTSRSWEMFARVYAVATVAGLRGGVIDVLAAGCVGKAAANEVLNYIANLDLPDPEVLLRTPGQWEVDPRRSDVVYAVCSSVNAALQRNNTADRWINAGHVLADAARAGHADIAVTFGGKWLSIRPENTFPPGDVMTALSPILTEMRLLMPSQD